MSGATYKGVPLEELDISTVHWTEERAAHLRTRQQRKDRPERDIEPEWADEAATDPYRLIGIADSTADPEAQSILIVGWAPSVPPTGAVLKVWVWSDEPAESSVWEGGSAAVAGRSLVQRYQRERGDRE